MKQIRFRCKYCSDHEIRKKFTKDFFGWAYTDVEWSDFENEVPPLSEKYWEHSDRVPKMGEFRIVKVQTLFDEQIGNEFYMEFVPEDVFYNDYEDVEQIRDSAIVQCRFEELILADACVAWIKIKVLQVITFPELFEKYPVCLTDCELEGYAGMDRCENIGFMNAPWEEKYWTSEGEVGEDKMFYTDAKGIRHLVLMHYFFIDSTITYFGNIVQSK